MSAETLSLDNSPQANIKELTKFDADEAAGQTALTVKNTDGFAADDFIVLGRPGAEKSEIGKVSSTTGAATITIASATSFAHKKFEAITNLRGDKIRVYKATNVDGSIPDDSDFSLDSTATIEADQKFTYHTVATGGSGFWFKITYYHSVNLTETELSASDAVRGGDSGQYVTLEEIRLEAGYQNNPDITDQMISDRREDATSQVRGCLVAAGYTLPLTLVPSIVKNLTKLWAAGYLLLQDYGVGADGTNKEGQAKIDLAEKLCDKIKDHSTPLVDDQGNTLSSQSYIDGWPDDTTKDASESDGGGDKFFTRLKVF